MKKLLLVFLAAICFVTTNAQVSKQENEIATGLVKANSKLIGLSENELKNVFVSSTYQTVADGIRMIYLQQSFHNIPVFNQMQVLAFRNNKLVSVSGGRIENIDQLVNNINGVPVISSVQAVKAAVSECKLNAPLAILPLHEADGKTVFGTLGISLSDVKAQLVWLPVSSKKVSLTWEVELAPLKTSDHWMIRVDASNAIVLDKNNLTVYENLPSPSKKTIEESYTANLSLITANTIPEKNDNLNNSPSVVSSASYRVVPYPAESPNHTGGTPALVTDPWTMASGNAVSLKWNYDGTTYFDSTRGNNVWAQEDRDNNNNTFGKAGLSTTAEPTLTFNYTPDFAQAPTVTTNQQQAITNLFYWNNIMHDISYLYGFDEPSGNFQANNQGRGGLGNDYVIADAQDAGGTNNANFSTPVDGQRPRMQMYLFTSTTPNRDGDLDAGVIDHEFTHGISTRLTGGPANSSCLNNAEQGGEGWSDYFALMTTTKWSTAQSTDGALARPMGTYVLGQPVTGAGIRQHPYSTTLSIDPWTYADMTASGGEVHNIGEIWCTALWEMTWEMIAVDGINPNLYNPAAIGGNSAALKLVLEGMRLQPCSPGYIDARNAILKADTIFFGAKYSCAIWKAFAKRGMGKGASEGSSNSTTDQVASFIDNGGASLLLNQNVTSQQEGLNITYTNHVSAGTCGSLTNYVLTDTLPANVSYVNGGTYNAGNRVVSFPVNLTAGTSQDYIFTVMINAGSYFPSVTLLNEQVTGTAGTIPSGWTASSTTTSVWTTQSTTSHSAPNSFFTPNRTSASDQKLETTNAIALGTIAPVFSFWHLYNSEAGWDGGVVEISTNGGSTWTDLGSKITSGGYNGSLASSTNPLTGRSAFTGNSGVFVKTTIDLSAYANQSAKFRFRFGSDESVAATGWNVDDILLQRTAVVNMRSNLINSQGTRLSFSDTVTTILQSTCTTATIGGQPANATVCSGSNATFSISATGTSVTYQWQISTDGGSTYTNVSGANSSTLSLTNVSASMNNYRYRCQVTNSCTAATNSNPATLTVNALPSVPVASNGARCGQGSVGISANPAAGETIDWYANAAGGSALLTGSVSFSTPVISATTIYYAEARNTSTSCISQGRTAVTATINAIPAMPQGTGASRCGSGSVTISATPGAGETIDWYAASTGGTALLTNSSSFITPTLSSTTTYYAEARNTGTGCVSAGRTAIAAIIVTLPSSPSGSGASRCGPGSVTISATPGAGETIDWYAASTGGTALLTNSSSFIAPTLSSSTTYYAEARNTGSGCVSATRTSVTATVNALPVSPAGTDVARCGSGSVTISATAGAGETIDWYAASAGGIALLSGSSSFITPTLSSTTVYYAEARNISTGCISATRTAVNAMINALPVSPVGADAARCGSGSVTISATPGVGETIDWYAASAGGTALLSASSSFITPTLSSTTVYYAEARNTGTGCISATRTAVNAVINVLPAPPAGTDAARCGSGSVTILATPGAGETIDWYAVSTGGTALLSASPSFITPTLSSTTIYYAEARNTGTGCISTIRTSVNAIINSIPVSPVGTNASDCGPASVTIFANPGAGETIDWYAASTGGSPLSAGSNSYTTPTLSSSTTYFAEARNLSTGCISSARTAVNAIINSSTNSTTHISICATELPYTWNSNTFNSGGTYTVILVNAAGCDSLAKLLLDVAAAINIFNVTGGGSYTTGGSGVAVGLSGSEIGVNYQLQLNGNPLGSPVAGTNSPLSFGNQLQAGTYTVLATTPLCTQAMSGSATVTITTGPPAQFTVTGGGTYCSGGTGIAVGLSGSETEVNYQLRRNAGSINVGTAVAGTGAAISFGLQTIASDYSVLATNITSLATQTMLNSVTVRIATATTPGTPGTITGPTDACPYMGVSNVTYTIRLVTNATSYLWTAPSGATIIGSNTDSFVVIQYPTTFVSGTLSVVAVNACFGNVKSGTRSLSITRKIPATPGTITASISNPCPIVGTASTANYTIRQVANATGYNWTLSSGIVLVSGLGDTGIVVRFASGFTSGTVSVNAYNSCAASVARSLTVSATVPAIPTSISGPVNVCSYIGQPTNATYSITAVPGATSYLWAVPANSSIVSGQGVLSIDVSFAAGFSSGSITVKSVSGCGSSAVRSLSLVKTVAKPGVITPSAPSCPSTNVTYSIAAVPFANSYLWTVPTNALYVSGQGTTSFTISYKPTFVSGTVSVKSVNNCSTSAASSLAVSNSGCSAPPPPFAKTKASPVLTVTDEMSVFPNPNNGVFTINLNAVSQNEKLMIQIVDIYGKIVKEQAELLHKNGNIAAKVIADNLPAGIYEVRCNIGGIRTSKNIIIVK